MTNKNGSVLVTYHAGVTALSTQTIRIPCNSRTIDPRTVKLGMWQLWTKIVKVANSRFLQPV